MLRFITLSASLILVFLYLPTAEMTFSHDSDPTTHHPVETDQSKNTSLLTSHLAHVSIIIGVFLVLLILDQVNKQGLLKKKATNSSKKSKV
jgi:hypothetical protein